MTVFDNFLLDVGNGIDSLVLTTTEKMLLTYHLVGGAIWILLCLLAASVVANAWLFRHRIAKAIARRRQKKALGNLCHRTVRVVRRDGTTLPATLIHRERDDSTLVLDLGNGCLKYVTSDGCFNTKSSIFVKWEEVPQ